MAYSNSFCVRATLKQVARQRGRWPAMLALGALALLFGASSAVGEAAAPVGTGKTVLYGLSRSGSAGVTGGACGTRLQCFKTAINEANAATTASVENVALAMINVDPPDQDVNFKLGGKQLLIAPDADPNLNGQPDFVEAVNKVSLGGGTCFTCALQAAERSFVNARPESKKVIVLVSERVNTFASTGFNSSGVATGYPAMTMGQMAGRFDANTVVRAFAVGPGLTCASDPNRFGSLDAAAAVTPGGTCVNVASFDGLGAVLTDIVNAAGPAPIPPPDTTAPIVTITTPANGASTEATTPSFTGAAGAASGDTPQVTVKVWQGSDTSIAPLQTLSATVSAGAFSAQANPALAPGGYTVQAEQRDAAGNVGRSAAVTFTVVSPPPPPPPGGSGGSYADAVLAAGAVGYWRLGEASGTVAVDRTASNTAGTYVNGVTLGVAGAIGGDGNTAVRLDGGNDLLNFGDPVSGILDFGIDDFTAEAWIKPSSNDERPVFGKRTATHYWQATVTDDPNHAGQLRMSVNDGVALRQVYSTLRVDDGNWHHVAVTVDRDAGITIYLDGSVAGRGFGATTGNLDNTGNFQVGKLPDYPNYRGDIDEVALYRTLLTPATIAAHAQYAP